MLKPYVKTGSLLCSVALVLLAAGGCTQIKVRPKNTDLTNFGRAVTNHFMDANPKTYEASQKALANEIAPSVLNQLKANGQVAKSPVEAKTRVAGWKKQKLSSSVQIKSADEGDTDSNGLVSVEVKGELHQSSSKGPAVMPFDVVYKVGVSAATKKPIVASIQFK